MLDNLALPSQEAERAELDAVAEALARSPRLLRLVRYLGEKYFLGETDQLNEYNIATEVFGRSKTTFDAGEDAIARVEAHRLRKKLKEFYDTEGRNNPVQLSIPSGTYVPVFAYRAAHGLAGAPVAQPEAHGQESALAHGSGSTAPVGSPVLPVSSESPRIPGKRWMIFSLAGAIVLIATAAFLYFRFGAAAKTANPTAAAAPAEVGTDGGAGGLGAAPIRMMAGYTGGPQTDSSGAVWQADRYFSNGGAWRLPATFIARTSDPLLFGHWRTGDFFYDIPLKPGTYEVHLYFVTLDRSTDNVSSFSVLINGNVVLRGFDVNIDAMGENIADERIFRDVSPAPDGRLHLGFTSERGAPAVSAVEILPGTPRKQLPIRIVTQPTSFTDHNGNFWHSDTYFMNGRNSAQRQQVAGSPDADLFAAERYGHFSYAIPVDTRDRYTLVLHFAEFYFGPSVSGTGGVGSRLFRVMCNGSVLLDDFDIYKEVGSLHELTKTFYHLKPSAQGKLNLTFEPIANNATVSGIEVLDEGQ